MKSYLLKFSLLLFFYLFNNGVAFSDINTEKFTSLFDKIKNESDHGIGCMSDSIDRYCDQYKV